MAADSKATDPKTLFYPPKQLPLMARLVQSISYPLAQVLYKFRIQVSEESVGKVRAVDNARLVFVCNHPTLEDGMALFVLSARLGKLFHYIVAYESFKGILGWFIQRLGCYSIRRGLGDRASISQTLALLKEPRCRLVIFPEGGCSYQNDTIMSFRPGAIQLPMSVLGQLAKKAKSPEQIPDFYVVPLSLKYRYGSPMRRVIDDTLTRLETALTLADPAGELTGALEGQSGMPSDDTFDEYFRLRRVAHAVIVRIETEARENGMMPDKEAADEAADELANSELLSWNARIERLRQAFIHKCESALNIEPNLNLPIRERVYKVQSLLEEMPADGGAVPSASAEANSVTLNTLSREELYWDAVRLLNFDAIYDGYVAESPTSERFLDTLTRLEREVFHLEHAQPKAPRKACFYIGDPINLKAYLADYQRDRSGTIATLSQSLRQVMQDNLDLA